MGEILNRFSNRLVRDLAWVIASPPLLSGKHNDTHWWSYKDCLREFNDCLPALITLDENPAPLIKHLKKLTSGRLGLRFESFIAYWLTLSPNFELLAQNIQVIEPFVSSHKKGSHTHGELDFIIRNIHTNKIIHLEVAVKFYLGAKPYEDPFRWFGTNTKDQLGKKVEHLKNHQTQLSNKFSSYLNKDGYLIDNKQCFLKGRLFYPREIDTAPQGVTENHLRGRWDYASTAMENKLLFPLDKNDWLAELNYDDLYQRDLETSLIKNEKALCYVNATQGLKEIERIFYLPESFHFPKSKL